MANSWFQFKKFTVQQQHNAMKVTTDSCLFGAMLPAFPQEGKGFQVLDIGTGTGLLSLMFAQKNPEANITAIEIDPESAAEAFRNFEDSPYKNRMTTITADIQYWQPLQHFDLIFTNPPFYENQLAPPDPEKNRAHHNQLLTFEGLLESINRLLSFEGNAWVLLPAYRVEAFEKLLDSFHFFVHYICHIQPHPGKKTFRTVCKIGRKPHKAIIENLLIKWEDQSYSTEFIRLLQPYYLFL
jgi:tRNA1Val (adenine37-N6)-methyltransferase